MQTKYLEGPPMFESAEHCLPSSCKQMSSVCACNSCVWTSGITYSNLTFVDNHFGKVLQGRLILSFNSVIMTSAKLTYQSLNYSNLTKLHSPCVSIFQGLRADTVRLLSPEDPAKISAHNAIESISEIRLQTVLLDVFPARNPAGAPELVRADVHLVCGAAWVLPGSPEPPPASQQHRFSAAAAALYVRSGSRRGPSRTARGRRRRDVPAEPAAVSTRRTAVAGG
ncbi:uncharacterized protein LOC120426591 isoform X4 [Culex pipiens pallens]|uniref:uncharacterized protein LOC120426591 isoform X4 n=1 Tax=Culex pipiens pallens TaxID=42434 RepID=UPI0022AACA5E|nr:uncharacterized protein LOC120426591 isoform X4 [Culex pipiens pallens]